MQACPERHQTGHAMTDAQHIRPLTSLRFFAAFWVVLFHYWPALSAAAAPMVVGKGYLGVELFFILSGFILCHVYRTEVEEGRFAYGGFLWARLARVYPLHLATLVGMGVLAAAPAGTTPPGRSRRSGSPISPFRCSPGRPWR